MLIRELIAGALELVFDLVGINGVAIGALALVVAGLWYLREAAGAFVVLARYSRMLSIIGFVVLGLFVAGTATGVVEPGFVGSLANQIAELLD
ncbi:hypothetical protein C475_14478 [Halosimplex carlsbadense 2-9-1]|uniref:Uncharacterized protein n=1 Tax=Halosimplex carlsbadense 2-9-1 TaxID=797114 RepID=M0CM89_9EURY|nr:hypothetical protein [Halosimplex carlsbadense]ELZ23487.1 hypothetical protein C475_14478 [Halosimplex carlsbadense 2-9-1]